MPSEMNLDLARAIVDAAERRAVELGIRVATCVVDEGGNTVAFARMDGTQLASSTLATGKAYTALAWQRPSGALWSIVQPGAGGFGINTIDHRFVVSGGGIPLVDGDRFVGGVGVSGGSADQDADCAAAGVATFEQAHAEERK